MEKLLIILAETGSPALTHRVLSVIFFCNQDDINKRMTFTLYHPTDLKNKITLWKKESKDFKLSSVTIWRIIYTASPQCFFLYRSQCPIIWRSISSNWCFTFPLPCTRPSHGLENCLTTHRLVQHVLFSRVSSQLKRSLTVFIFFQHITEIFFLENTQKSLSALKIYFFSLLSIYNMKYNFKFGLNVNVSVIA